MTHRQIRTTVAKAVGWKQHKKTLLWKRPGGTSFSVLGCYIPDYINDLNAMREAEMTLTDFEYRMMTQYLYAWSLDDTRPDRWSRLETSPSAYQRCVTFLKAKNLWKYTGNS